jgi:hypothetical protein
MGLFELIIFLAIVALFLFIIVLRYHIRQKHRPTASIKLIFQDKSYKWYSYIRDTMECSLSNATYTKKTDRQIMGRLSNLLHEQGWPSCKIVITRDTYQKEHCYINSLQDNIKDNETWNHRKEQIMKWGS